MAPPSSSTSDKKTAPVTNAASIDLTTGKIIRSLVGILARSAEAFVTRNREQLHRERALLANLILHGSGMRSERLGVALYSLRGEVDTLTFTRDDIQWNALARCSIITPSLLEKGDWQISDMVALLSWLKANNRLAKKEFFVDVGANIGTSSIPLALRSNLSGIAIEPVSDNYELLKKNIDDNHLKERILPVKKAVAKTPGTLTMIQDEKNSGGAEVKTSSGVQGFGSGSIRPESVDADRLDNILASKFISIEQVAFVWSDTQGFEHEVVASGETLWRANVPLFVEVWPKGLTLHQGRNEFLRLVTEHFSSFLPITVLLKDGSAAKPLPIQNFTEFFEGLLGNGEDVLFLPR